MPTIKRTLLLVAVLAAGLVAGCDKPNAETAGPIRKYDPPKITCPAFHGGAAATLGVSGPAPKVDNPPSDADGKTLLCTWDSSSYTLQVQVSALRDKEASQRTWDLQTRDLINPVTAPDLGDKAIFSSPKGPDGTVELDVLDDNLQVTVSALPQGATTPNRNKLADTVLAITKEVIAAQPHA